MGYNAEDKYSSYSKVPYDNEPINRSSSYQKKTVKSSMGANKFLTIVLSLVVILNIFMGVALINLYSKTTISGRVVNYNNYTIPVDTNSGTGGNTTELANMIAVTKARQSAVIISAGYASSLDTTIDSKADFFNMKSHGSGVILEIDKNNGVAYIVTCYHVINGYTGQVYIMLYDSTTPLKAQTIQYSALNDIAVIKVENPQLIQSNCRAAEVADSSLVVMGETAHAVGNPLNADFRSSTGTITNPEHLVAVGSTTYRVIGTDTPINPGNSGGGLFNSKGELIGIINAKTQLVDIDNMAYALPSNLAVSLAQNIIRNTYPVKADLGCTFAVKSGVVDSVVVGDRELLDYAVVITSVDSGSAASNAGLKVNDEIISFTYKNKVVDCRSQYSFADHAFNLNVGDKVSFVVLRGGTQLVIEVTITKVVAADR